MPELALLGLTLVGIGSAFFLAQRKTRPHLITICLWAGLLIAIAFLMGLVSTKN